MELVNEKERKPRRGKIPFSEKAEAVKVSIARHRQAIVRLENKLVEMVQAERAEIAEREKVVAGLDATPTTTDR